MYHGRHGSATASQCLCLKQTDKTELVTTGSDAYVSEDTNHLYKISEGLHGSEECTK